MPNSTTREGNTNSCEFVIEIDPGSDNKRLRTITIEQIGLTSEYEVRLSLSVLSHGYSWKESLVDSQKFVDRNQAWDAYKKLRNDSFALERKNPSTKMRETITKRPVGIFDHRDSKYLACNLICLKSDGRQAGRCFYIRDYEFARADGLPLTNTDLDALRYNAWGQVHVVSGQPGDTIARVHSEVDSSD